MREALVRLRDAKSSRQPSLASEMLATPAEELGLRCFSTVPVLMFRFVTISTSFPVFQSASGTAPVVATSLPCHHLSTLRRFRVKSRPTLWTHHPAWCLSTSPHDEEHTAVALNPRVESPCPRWRRLPRSCGIPLSGVPSATCRKRPGRKRSSVPSFDIGTLPDGDGPVPHAFRGSGGALRHGMHNLRE